MTAARRLSSVKFLRPFNLAALQVHGIQAVEQFHFSWELDVALSHALDDLLYREALFLKFRDVLVAVFGAGLRRLRFAFGCYGGDVHLAASHDWRGEPAPRDLLRPLYFLGLGPPFGEPRVCSDGI